jgi:hypothetical protein
MWELCPIKPGNSFVQVIPAVVSHFTTINTVGKKDSWGKFEAMVRTFLCTKTLGQITRGDSIDVRVPPPYYDLERRWQKRETLSGLLGRPYPPYSLYRNNK